METLYRLTFQELYQELTQVGIKGGHAKAIWQGLYRFVEAAEPNQVIPSPWWRSLGEGFDLQPPVDLVQQVEARDGTRKFLFETRDGLTFEAVLIPQGRRKTLCLSVQIGCRFACRFCATGQMGWVRNLSEAEIVSQVILTQQRTKTRLTNLVFMGMGEPLDNLVNLERALDIVTHPHGMALPPRRITVSTLGLVKGIDELTAKRWPYPLAVSLHHCDPLKRRGLMPGTANDPLETLLGALERYQQALNRPVFFEYLLLDGLNDSPADAAALIELTGRIRCRINLIAFHPFPLAPYCPTPTERANGFYRQLQAARVPVIFRKSRGEEIQAACGQLARCRITEKP